MCVSFSGVATEGHEAKWGPARGTLNFFYQRVNERMHSTEQKQIY